jgi:4-hydroxythreonine-4-phosphate dehydrogenase
MGEPAGIGGDITLAAWTRRRSERLSPFFVLDDPHRLAYLAARLGLEIPFAEITSPAEAPAVFASALPVLPLDCRVSAEPGLLDVTNAEAVLESIRRAVALVQAGEAAAVVTNPIHKQVLMEAGFHHPGHTEYLAELTASPSAPVMMLACTLLKVVPVTVHLPLAEVSQRLTPELIFETASTTASDLQRLFGIATPRIAVAGLNPHAGEGGRLGGEDAAIVRPAVERLQAAGIDARGPLSADTMFHAAARRTYDAALCMYHDQALIPIKTPDFDGGVNVTLGLPIVRSSPDHGTALDIAGKGTASPTSLLAALRMASEMAAAAQRSAA